MADSTLPYTATTRSGDTMHFDFPLHEQTVSQQDVARMLGGVLEGLTQAIGSRADVSDGDVLQALAMAMAVRAEMVKAPAGAAQNLSRQLVETAMGATEVTRHTPGGTA
jgi:putative heme iron utilization protein